MVEVVAGQTPFDVSHSKIFVPNAKPVIVVFANVGVVMVAPPEIKVHEPVPIAGVLPAMIVFGVAQSV